MKSELTLSWVELETLVDWVRTLEPKPDFIKLTSVPTGIGPAIRAEIETAEGEGRYKDLTDYESW
jgi:hypothetical protein